MGVHFAVERVVSERRVVLVTDIAYRGLCLGKTQFTEGCACCNRYSLQMVVLGTGTVDRLLCLL